MELTVLRSNAAAWPTVQKHRRLAVRIPDLLVIDFVDVRDLQSALIVRFNWRIKRSKFHLL